ncbi:hypothetical protein BDV97DRAFT_395986 [Delphinella strobiligena]|nr:hypothetical protein BDV97DRAFT_395986 [Delphinella strobiligena]
MDARKIFVIIGITGNQGGSVARTFLNDPEMLSVYRLRGISRDFHSSQSQKLAAQGVEMVNADLHDPSSLLKAFCGAHVIFSVTDFWTPYLDKSNQARALEEGKHIGRLSYELEYDQGRNIADAASKAPELERLVVSMLCSTRRRSHGLYDKIWHFDSKADMITYIKTTYPDLARKMSELNMGVFFQAWRFVPQVVAPHKTDGDEYVLYMPSNPDTPVPFVDPTNDTGPFVRALLALSPGIQLYGETALISWTTWLSLWGKILGKKTRFEQVSVEFSEKELSRTFPQGFGTEIAEMFEFSGIYGYDGGDSSCKRKEELGIEIQGLSSIEDFIQSEDGSMLGI